MNRDESRRALLDILNRVDELQIEKLLIVFTTTGGQVGFGGSGLDTVTVIGMAEIVKDMARDARSKNREFSPFADMTVSGVKPS